MLCCRPECNGHLSIIINLCSSCSSPASATRRKQSRRSPTSFKVRKGTDMAPTALRSLRTLSSSVWLVQFSLQSALGAIVLLGIPGNVHRCSFPTQNRSSFLLIRFDVRHLENNLNQGNLNPEVIFASDKREPACMYACDLANKEREKGIFSVATCKASHLNMSQCWQFFSARHKYCYRSSHVFIWPYFCFLSVNGA